MIFRNRLGTVELDDQIAGIEFLIREKKFIDRDRIAITGWSYGFFFFFFLLFFSFFFSFFSFLFFSFFFDSLIFVVKLIFLFLGGYASLMGYVQNQDYFKVCISGAPVTSWDLYDTAYTEKYMGDIRDNQENYLKASILSYIKQFPVRY